MNKERIKAILRVILRSLLVWSYASMLFYFAFTSRFPRYVLGIFLLGAGLGYFLGRLKDEPILPIHLNSKQ